MPNAVEEGLRVQKEHKRSAEVVHARVDERHLGLVSPSE
jgi:hypothetical protein